MSDLISRQAAIDALYNVDEYNARSMAAIKNLPSAQPELEKKIKEIGYTGKEGQIYIGGRLFGVRELAQ